MLVRRMSRCSRSSMRPAATPAMARRRWTMVFMVTGCGPTRHRHGSRWAGMPARLNPIGWLAMISLSDRAAGRLEDLPPVAGSGCLRPVSLS
jgi:hypothetical protein